MDACLQTVIEFRKQHGKKFDQFLFEQKYTLSQLDNLVVNILGYSPDVVMQSELVNLLLAVAFDENRYQIGGVERCLSLLNSFITDIKSIDPHAQHRLASCLWEAVQFVKTHQ